MKRNNKKGFTIIELIVVIAVIAILAAVLIPTFSSIIKKANTSADIQAVNQMNTALAIDGAVAPTSFDEFYAVLADVGFTAEDYKPLYSNRCFYWVKSINTVVYYDREAKEIIYPSNIAEQSGWYALDGSFDTTSSTITALPTENNGTYSFDVNSAADFVKAAELTQENETILKDKTVEIVLKTDIDLQGADVCFADKESVNVVMKSSDDNTARTITGLYVSDAHTVAGYSAAGELSNTYGHSLFNKVKSLTVKNITIKDAVIGGYGASQSGFFAGYCTGDAIFENVTVENSTVQGEKKVGVLVGYFCGGNKVTFTNVNINNCRVSSLQGEAGIVFGVYNGLKEVESNTSPFTVNTLNVSGSSVGIYSNEVLTHTNEGVTYEIVKYSNDAKTEYRVSTAQIGFIGDEKNYGNGTITVSSNNDLRLYTAIDTVNALSAIKGKKQSS